MGNTTENEKDGDIQKDEIPRDTQVDRQHIESPSNEDQEHHEIEINQIKQEDQIPQEGQNNQENQNNNLNNIEQTNQMNEINKIGQENQLNQFNQIEQTNQNYIAMGGGQQNDFGMADMGQEGVQNEIYQGTQEIQHNIEGSPYEMNQQNINEGEQFIHEQNNEIQYNQEYQLNPENQLYEKNQGGAQENQQYYTYPEGENQEVEGEEGEGEGEGEAEGEAEGEEGEGEGEVEGEEYVEDEEMEVIEGDGDDVVEIERDVEEGIEGGNNQVDQERNQYQVDKQENNQIHKESRSYQFSRDGKVYKINEEMKQYTVNQGDKNYQIKKETKTTNIEQNTGSIPNNQNYNYIQGEGQSSQIKTSIKSNMKFPPKDSNQKVYIQSSRYTDNVTSGGYSQYYSNIPRFMSFNKSTETQSPKIHSNINIMKTENISELIEIPRTEYEKFAGRETILVGGGMDTGEYKFRGQGIIITQAQEPVGKITITEEDILKEINRRKNKPKKAKKRRYEILDKFYAITEFDGKPIRNIEKIEQQQKQRYEYEEQEQFYSSSQGKVGYQFNSKESQFQQEQNPKLISQQYQFQESQQINSQQYQAQSQGKSQTGQMKIEFSQNQNLGNMNINMNDNNYSYQKIVLTSGPFDNYSKYLLEQINKLRTDPQSFINIIEEAKKKIIQDKHGRLVYNGKMKIALTSGESAFNSAINILKKSKPVEKLIFNPYIVAEAPKSENELKYKNDLKLKVDNMVNNGISIKSYWKDIIKDPEISFLMMIVDDIENNSGMRRKDLLDPIMKFIGISSTEINGNFISYITLSTKP